MPFFRQLEDNILKQQQWWKSRGIIVSQTDDTFCCPDWSAWESRTSFWWQLFNQLKYQSTFSYLYIVEIMFSKIFMMIQKFFKYSCLNQPEWRITFPATERWVLRTDSPSLLGRCLKGLFGVGFFWAFPEELAEIQPLFICWALQWGAHLKLMNGFNESKVTLASWTGRRNCSLQDKLSCLLLDVWPFF